MRSRDSIICFFLGFRDQTNENELFRIVSLIIYLSFVCFIHQVFWSEGTSVSARYIHRERIDNVFNEQRGVKLNLLLSTMVYTRRNCTENSGWTRQATVGILLRRNRHENIEHEWRDIGFKDDRWTSLEHRKYFIEQHGQEFIKCKTCSFCWSASPRRGSFFRRWRYCTI